MEKSDKSVFCDPKDDDPENGICEIESLCLNCGKNGITRILPTKIPFFKEVIVMSFTCEMCGWENNEIQSAGQIQEKGVHYNVTVKTPKDLTRSVVKTKTSILQIPELEFEIPAGSQEGGITTIEGIIDRAIAGLSQKRSTMEDNDPAASIMSDFIIKISELKMLENPFHIVIDDPSGNSFVENFCAPKQDENLEVHNYTRTSEQDELLGIKHIPNKNAENSDKQETSEDFHNEVVSFPTNCSLCNSICQTNMKLTKIPQFKEVIIMATTCDHCGHRTSEVKSGSGIEPTGIRIELQITGTHDMTRDVLKSETCKILIPELELEVGSHTLGSKFTTLEGLLTNIKEQLKVDNPFIFGDAARRQHKEKMETFLTNLDEVCKGNKNITFIMDDPCGNCYIQNIYAPDPDPKMTVVHYERTFEQNEELGLNDMNTENYS
ncbi:zinc finger protein ZPR1 [Centruroides vittatus]|uniref:zinc finger protein ZPR1 n=1 Tax=Centruroides vittatus TaxID=120091 RepID=UPI00350EFBEA